MNRVWITRSQPGATALATHLRRVGIDVLVEPLIRVESIDSEPPESSWDVAVFLSQHAVQRADLQKIRAKQTFAIGSATQRALLEHGVASDLPATANSEGLLRSIANSYAPPASILIVCGEGGRGMLPRRLSSIGFSVHEWVVYRRIVGCQPSKQISECDIVELSSVAALSSYIKLFIQDHQDGHEIQKLVVPSRRIAKQAVKHGFAKVMTSAGATPRAIELAIRRSLADG